MRKLLSFMFASLDGYHETHDQDIGWQDVDEEFDEWDLAQLDAAGTIMLGRVTYEGFAEFWSSPAGHDADPVRAKLLGALPKVVVSRTMREAQWENTTAIGADAGADVDAEIRKLKEQPGKDIQVIGSAKLTAHLIGAGLLDELRVMVSPVLLGSGNPAFPVPAQVTMELVQSRQFGNGNVLLVYRPLAAGQDEADDQGGGS